MEVEIRLEPGRKEPRAVIYAGTDTPELQELVQRLSGVFLGPVPAFQGERAVLLEPGEVYRFYTDGKGVSAQTEAGVYAVRLRLYELEERLDTTRFVRISNSEIINLDRVTAIDLSLAGTIRMTLEGAVHAYVSRRYVKKIKDTLNLRGGDKT